MPLPLPAIALAVASGWMLYRTLRAPKPAAGVLAVAASALPVPENVADRDGLDTVRTTIDGVHVVLRIGAPLGDDPPWTSGMGATARYVLGGGPRFVAEASDPEVHLRTATPERPLAQLYPRTIPIVGDHVEARPLVARALGAIEPAGAMTAPHFRSDGVFVSAWLAQVPPDDVLPDVALRLARIVARLARHRDDALDAYAEAAGGVVRVDPFASPTLRAEIAGADGERPIVVEARISDDETRLVAAGVLAVRAVGPTHVALPVERVPLARLHPHGQRLAPAGLLRAAPRALVRGEPGTAILEWSQPPSPSELAAGVEILRALGGRRRPAGPFR